MTQRPAETSPLLAKTANPRLYNQDLQQKPCLCVNCKCDINSPLSSTMIPAPSVTSGESQSIRGHALAEPVSPDLKHMLPYYLPCLSWIPSYNMRKLVGDIVAGLSLASFQIPLAMSFASSLAHVEPICGLFGLAFTPMVYAVFGSVPQMIVGPESAISVVIGQSVEIITKHDSEIDPFDLIVVISFLSGLILFMCGLLRLGFLDNVLSRALLRGFISAVGLLMIINSLITELGLRGVYSKVPDHYHTPFEKILFLIEYIPTDIHLPTSVISLCTFVSLFTIKLMKKRYIKKGYTNLVFIPEILCGVLVTIVLSKKYDWTNVYDVEIVGNIQTDFRDISVPFSKGRRPLFHELLSSSFLVAILGFFESTTASKSLGTTYDLEISSNRELVALGACNMAGSLFSGLASFGGYGRSKVNAMSGAQTTMSGAFMGVFVLCTIKFFLGYVSYIPECVLSVITTIVGISLLDEAPADIIFNWKAGGYTELIIFTATVLMTMFHSVEAGVTLGVAFSVIRVIRQSTKSRIQILGRDRTTGKFHNVDDVEGNVNFSQLEEVEGCLIVKVVEALTFTNANDLKARLARLELYGSSKIHPAAPRSRDASMTRYVIFDMRGMLQIDASATQILLEIVEAYKKRHITVVFTKVTNDKATRARLENTGVARLVDLRTSNIALGSIDLSIQQDPYFENLEEALRVIDDIEASGRGQFALRERSYSYTSLV